MNKDIFITQEEKKKFEYKSLPISSPLPYAEIKNTIPKGSINYPEKDNIWRSKKLTEWRWRFLEFANKIVVEISKMNYDSNKRVYFNCNGQWIHRNVPEIYDDYVKEEYYFYSNE